MKKAGKIYLKVAKNLLEKNYSEMYEKQRDLLLTRADASELDAYVNLKRPIENGCYAIRRALEDSEVYLPESFTDVILYSDAPAEELEAATETIKDKQFFERGKGEIIFEALSSIHDGRVMDAQSRFFDKARADERYLMLRAELIGFSALMEEYVFIEDALAVLGLLPESRHEIEKIYNEHRVKYKEFYSVKNVHDLATHIRRADYKVLSGSVATALGDPIVAEAIARQIQLHCGTPETWH